MLANSGRFQQGASSRGELKLKRMGEMKRSRSAHIIFLCCTLVGAVLAAAHPGAAADVASINGKVVDAATGLGLPGVNIESYGTTSAATTTDKAGTFRLQGLQPGRYTLFLSLNGYETTASEQFYVSTGQARTVTLSIQRTQNGSSNVRVLGRTTIRASQTLQSASLIYQATSAPALAQQGYFRAADYLNQLPGLVGSNVAQPGDDVSLNVRGIGSLETLALIDGHPIGPRGDYNYELSPVFGLRSVDVFYGSGGSDLYGVNAIGGVVNMQTLDPTLIPAASLFQSVGTFSKLATAVQTTGTLSGKLGYALAYGTQGLDGPIKQNFAYQASAAYDQYATDPAVRALGIYKDDTGFVNRSGLLKMRYDLSRVSRLTATYLGSYEWDDKTGNGDNDYLPYQVALATGDANLAAKSGSDPCPAGQFTVSTANAGNTPGFGPNGVPDGGSPCQTPQSYAAANFGYQGAGPAWQSYHSNDYHIRFDTVAGRHMITLDGFSNFYHHSYDRTHSLPFQFVGLNPSTGVDNQANPFWYNTNDTNTGLTLSDNIVGDNNEVGFGYFYENTASFYDTHTPRQTPALAELAPITHDTAFFLRDAYHPLSSHLATYLNAWFKSSTITNTSYVDPRIAFVYTAANDVFRLATGRTSTQPVPSQLDQPFSPASVGAFSGGGVSCSGFNSVGGVPSADLRPERATDAEFSYGHRFNSDSTVQATLYNVNINDQIYGLTVPLTSVALPGFDPTPYVNVVLTQCPGITPAQALALLGVSGNVNIGHSLARGIELAGRQRVTSNFFIDYTYNTQSSILVSSDPVLIDPAFGGSLFLTPGSQLPGVPLHKVSYAFDYTIARLVDIRLSNYHVSANNSNNLPAYGYSNLAISAARGQSSFGININNLFQSHADYRNAVGLGEPLPLNSHASAANGDYAQYFGAGSTERFNLPFRTIEFNYSIKTR